ncbi:MAG: hypothetical protein JNJ95_09770 [Dechloromonas sp.]|nr:hypothetical protein [Dechloromonas sp.]
MLAPLKDRQQLERDSADPQGDLNLPSAEEPASHITRLETEIATLSLALRQARRVQRKNATETTRKIIAQENQISRLNELNTRLRQRLERFEAGQRVIELGCQMQQLGAAYSEQSDAWQHICFLERTISAAQTECERLAGERDAAMLRLRSPLAY